MLTGNTNLTHYVDAHCSRTETGRDPNCPVWTQTKRKARPLPAGPRQSKYKSTCGD